MKTVSEKSSAPTSQVARFRLWFWLIAAVLFFVFISLVDKILLPFVVGILAAYFLDPAVRKLRARGWSRTLSAAAITVIFFLLVVTLCVVLVPLISHQLVALVREMPAYVNDLQMKYTEEAQRYFDRINLTPDQIDTVKEAANNLGGTVIGWAGGVAKGAVQSGLALLNLILLVFITPVVAFYLLRDWEQVTTRFDLLLPRSHAATIREQLAAIDRTLSGFIRGQTNVCLIMASYYGIVLTCIGLKFGLMIGIMTGILLFVPFVGFATCFTISTVVALFQFDDTGHIIAVLATYGVGLLLESSVFTPRLVGSKVGLHPIWIIFGMLCGGTLFGFVGVLIAVPVTSVMGVLVRFALSRYLQSSLYSGTA